MPARIYLDHAATTPLRPEAAAAIALGVAHWANPSSPHAEGRKARSLLEDARVRIKAALGWNGELIFTSGASESAAIALSGAKAGFKLVSAVEHESILQAARGAEQVSVLADGALDADALADALEGQYAPLLALQSINSETGNLQDFSQIAQAVRGAGGLLLVDAAQSAGKLPLPPEADMVVLSAHKLGGPVGIGALLVRDFAMLEPAGGQERGYRRGTENMPAALGFAAALDASLQGPYFAPGVEQAVERLAQNVRAIGGVWLSDQLAHPTPFIHAIAMPAMSGSAQLMRFDMLGFAVSQGSACSSGSLKQSHVLQAMGIASEEAARIIRMSAGWNTSVEDIELFAEAWLAMARESVGRAA